MAFVTIDKLSNGYDGIKTTEFYTYNLSLMPESDLNLIVQKCFHLLRTNTSASQEHETAKAMLNMISQEKSFRAATNATLDASRTANKTIWVLIFAAILQTLATISK